MEEAGLALYCHVPFCVRRCAYCDFASEVASSARIGVFLEALAREAELSAFRGRRPKTVYVGGGTPTSLSNEELVRLFGVLSGAFELHNVREWTVEANPGTVDEGRLCLLAELGANRLSLGVQSFRDEALGLLGRVHSAKDAEKALRAARGAGFGNISVDLIFAVPGQTLPDLRSDIARALEFGPEHVSVYGLTYEDGTPLHRMRERGEVAPAGEELEREMYLAAIEDLERAGLAQYEISNFARPGSESLHNRTYWEGGEYAGLGPSAASFAGGVRWKNARDLGEYASRLAEGIAPVAESERLEPERAAREAVLLGLRTRRGVGRAEFEARTGFQLEDILAGAGERLLEAGWLECEGDRVRLSRQALPVADSVLADLA